MREILRKIGEEFGENIEFVQERKLRLPLSREKSFFYQKFLTDFKLKAIFRIIMSSTTLVHGNKAKLKNFESRFALQ